MLRNDFVKWQMVESEDWMTGSRVANGKRFEYIASFGYGGQTLYIVPEYDLIVVFTCELAGEDSGVNSLVGRTFEAVIFETNRVFNQPLQRSFQFQW